MSVTVEKRYFSIPDLAVRLSVPEETVRYWVRKSTVPFMKFGRHVRFDIVKIERWEKTKEVSCFKNQYI